MSVLKLEGVSPGTLKAYDFASAIECSDPSPINQHEHVPLELKSADKPIDPELQELAALKKEIAELKKALSDHAETAKKDLVTAREEGRLAGAASAESKERERTQLLQVACENARKDGKSAIEQQSKLAIELARAILAQILGDKAATLALVSETAAAWRARLDESSIVRITVSGEDFATEESLSQLRSGTGQLDIKVSPDLQSGGCEFELLLGSVDASIPLQAVRADELLARFGWESA